MRRNPGDEFSGEKSLWPRNAPPRKLAAKPAPRGVRGLCQKRGQDRARPPLIVHAPCQPSSSHHLSCDDSCDEDSSLAATFFFLFTKKHPLEQKTPASFFLSLRYTLMKVFPHSLHFLVRQDSQSEGGLPRPGGHEIIDPHSRQSPVFFECLP